MEETKDFAVTVEDASETKVINQNKKKVELKKEEK